MKDAIIAMDEASRKLNKVLGAAAFSDDLSDEDLCVYKAMKQYIEANSRLLIAIARATSSLER